MSLRVVSIAAAVAALLSLPMAFAESGASTRGTSAAPSPSASAAPEPSATETPAASASSATSAPGAPEASEQDGGAPAPSATEAPSAAPAPAAPALLGPSVTGPAAPGADAEAEQRKKDAERAVLVSRIDVAGTFARGLDATDAPIRQGGFQLGGSYRFGAGVVLTGRYAFASGHVTERLPGNRLGQFGVPNDVDVLETRHVFDVTVGWVLHTEGPIRVFAIPFLGPRVPVLVNAVAPRWAFEGEFGGRAGVWGSDAFEASAFIAYAPALAKATGLADVEGSILSDLRFGAGTAFRSGGPFFVTLGYEGDVLTLKHEAVTSHGLLVGLSYALE